MAYLLRSALAICISSFAISSSFLSVQGIAAAATHQDGISSDSSCPTVSTVYAKAVRANHPIAFYQMNEKKKPVMCDSSASHNNGEYAATGVRFNVSGPTRSTAIEASGQSGDIGTGGSGSGLSGNVSFTYEGWILLKSIRDESLVHMGAAGTGNIAGLSLWSNKAPQTKGPDYTCSLGQRVLGKSAIVLDTYDSTDCWNTTPARVNVYSGKWTYVAVVYKSSADTVTAYVNGVSLGSQTPVSMDLTPSTIGVGTWIDTTINQPFSGEAADVAVYATALSASQISAHYAAR